jgi:hypothetical protein
MKTMNASRFFEFTIPPHEPVADDDEYTSKGATDA